MLPSRCLAVLLNGTRRFSSTMTNQMGSSLKRVTEAINTFADISLAASWDNVGLLVEPSIAKNVHHILLTNDLTENVMREAIDLNVDLIVSYHPPIFAPLKRLTNSSWKSLPHRTPPTQTLSKNFLIEFTMCHRNAWNKFVAQERIIAKCLENKIALYSPHTSFDSIKGGVNDWLAESFDLESSKPIMPGSNPENGMGRICQLKGSPISPDEAANSVKRRTGLSHVRIARAIQPDKPIKSVAVCAGSGSSVLKNVVADLYVTGEMLHHDILDAVHSNTHVILTNHSDSERGYLKVFAGTLAASLENSVKVSVSKKDADPLVTV